MASDLILHCLFWPICPNTSSICCTCMPSQNFSVFHCLTVYNLIRPRQICQNFCQCLWSKYTQHSISPSVASRKKILIFRQIVYNIALILNTYTLRWWFGVLGPFQYYFKSFPDYRSIVMKHHAVTRWILPLAGFEPMTLWSTKSGALIIRPPGCFCIN